MKFVQLIIAREIFFFKNQAENKAERPVRDTFLFLLKQKLSFTISQSAFTYSKLTIETLEQGVKYVQS